LFEQVLPRRYLLRSVALEVFFRTHTNILLVFETYEQRNRVYRLLCDLCDLPFEVKLFPIFHFFVLVLI
jgi:hypothetical protein